jgi:hypothetical protein
MGSKLQKELKIIYFRYFSGFIFKQIRVFLKGF